MINQLIAHHYGYKALSYQQLSVGAGSKTYLLETDQGKFILKNPARNEMNNPEIEPQLCEFLLANGIPVSEFIKNRSGFYITREGDELFHLQKFVDGSSFHFNQAPDWLMKDSAHLLGKIHSTLKDFPPLPIGIGKNFFRNMTPQSALRSYLESIEIAWDRGDHQSETDLNFRINLMQRFTISPPNLDELTCGNTHGDYVISQMICGEDHVNAIIDWTSACIHPLAWEIMRSFVYSEPSCAQGDINIEKFIRYLQEYLEVSQLTSKDILMMPEVFYYQIAVCDYYHQYYSSTSENRDLFLHQARFSTQLMRWFDRNLEELKYQLTKI